MKEGTRRAGLRASQGDESQLRVDVNDPFLNSINS